MKKRYKRKRREEEIKKLKVTQEEIKKEERKEVKGVKSKIIDINNVHRLDEQKRIIFTMAITFS